MITNNRIETTGLLSPAFLFSYRNKLIRGSGVIVDLVQEKDSRKVVQVDYRICFRSIEFALKSCLVLAKP